MLKLNYYICKVLSNHESKNDRLVKPQLKTNMQFINKK